MMSMAMTVEPGLLQDGWVLQRMHLEALEPARWCRCRALQNSLHDAGDQV